MKTLNIEIISNEYREYDRDVQDALKTVLLEVKHDFLESGVAYAINYKKGEEFSLKVDNKDVDFKCHCQDDEDDCHCSLEDKIRKSLYQHAKLSYGCGCGGNCGCH